MNNVTIIASIGKNRELGINNELIWRIKEDMHFFKENTINKPIVMGRNTYLSLNNPLKDRTNIVLTTRAINKNDNLLIMRNVKDLLDYIKKYKKEVMIIGGASVYKEMLKYADKLLLTEIDETYNKADTFFPRFNKEEYDREILSEHKDIETGVSYKHLVYKKITNILN